MDRKRTTERVWEVIRQDGPMALALERLLSEFWWYDDYEPVSSPDLP